MTDCANIPTDSMEYVWNCATTGNTSANSLTPALGLLAGFAGVLAIVGLVILVVKLRAEQVIRINKWLLRIGTSFRYFLYGIAGLVPFAAAAGIGYGLSRIPGEGYADFGKVALIGIGGYSLVAGFGILVKKFIERVKRLRAETRELATQMEASA